MAAHELGAALFAHATHREGLNEIGGHVAGHDDDDDDVDLWAGARAGSRTSTRACSAA